MCFQLDFFLTNNFPEGGILFGQVTLKTCFGCHSGSPAKQTPLKELVQTLQDCKSNLIIRQDQGWSIQVTSCQQPTLKCRAGWGTCAVPSKVPSTWCPAAWREELLELVVEKKKVATLKGPPPYAALPIAAGNPSAGSAYAANNACPHGDERPHWLHQARHLLSW